MSVNKRIKITKSICKNKLTNRLVYEISLITYSMGYKHYLIVITLLERLCFKKKKERLFFILSKNIAFKQKNEEILAYRQKWRNLNVRISLQTGLHMEISCRQSWLLQRPSPYRLPCNTSSVWFVNRLFHISLDLDVEDH